jgi:hypothetical protein
VGAALFGLGLVCPLFIPIITSADLSSASRTVLSGLMVFGVPVFRWLIAAVFIGRRGLESLRQRLWSLLKKYVARVFHTGV